MNNKLASSFRDPSGYMFKENNKLFRLVNYSYKENYDFLMTSGLYSELVSKGYLVSHKEVKHHKQDCYKVLEPDYIPLITYPYEWSFSMFKDAALLTLKIQMISLRYGMILKDASSYNVQFLHGKPIFIDTLSFEKYQEGDIWVAYKQFCQHFLAPLLLMSYCDLRLNKLLITNIDGVPLDLTCKLLPWKALCRPFIFFNILMQAVLQKKYEHRDINFKKSHHISKNQLIAMNKQLQDFIRSMKFPSRKSEWGEYYTFTNYNEDAFQNKRSIIEKFLQKLSPKVVWDIGANNGLFTRIASNLKIEAIAFDIDPIACEKNYQQIKKEQEKYILPVLFDLTNPSPAIGWNNQERDNLEIRSSADVLMALAIIHHISISNNVPFTNVANYFSLLAPYLIIEFVPKEDSKVQKLLATREDIFVDYTEEGFEKAFSKFYTIEEKKSIQDSVRTLYLMKRISK